MVRNCFSCLFVAAFLFPAISQSQTPQSPTSESQSSQASAGSSACPIEILSFNAGGVSVRIRNTTDKKIVGLVFNAAIADATEHWKWVHWDFDDSRPLRNFGWNKEIKARATKRLTWDWGTYLDFEYIGSRWEEQSDATSCKCLWYKHKRSAFRPIELPPREGD
jgi:hypothetical protein